MRLFVRGEMDAVKEPGSQPAWQAGRPVQYRQSECSPVHVEASQCRAEAVSISLWCYSPFIAPWGPRRSEYVTFALFFFESSFFLQSFSPHYVVHEVSGFCRPGREEAPDWCRTFHISVQYCVRANSGIVSRV